MELTDFTAFILERLKIKQFQSETLHGSFEMIDAGFWLIGGFQFPQSLVMFCNSIELLLKAELELFDHELIIKQKLTAVEIKQKIKNGKRNSNQKSIINLEHTINTKEAVKRVEFIERYSTLIMKWKEKLYKLIEKRNKVIHRGHREGEQYSNDIVSIAIPFLKEFLYISNDILLDNLITQDIYREIQVSELVYSKLKEENQIIPDYILNTLAHNVRFTLAERQILEYENNKESERDYVLSNAMEKALHLLWGGDWVEEFCQICDSVRTFIKVKPYVRPTKGLIPVAVRCPKCGLSINENERYLAYFHVKLQEKTIENYFLNDFFVEDYNDSDLDKDLILRGISHAP